MRPVQLVTQAMLDFDRSSFDSESIVRRRFLPPPPRALSRQDSANGEIRHLRLARTPVGMFEDSSAIATNDAAPDSLIDANDQEEFGY